MSDENMSDMMINDEDIELYSSSEDNDYDNTCVNCELRYGSEKKDCQVVQNSQWKAMERVEQLQRKRPPLGESSKNEFQLQTECGQQGKSFIGRDYVFKLIASNKDSHKKRKEIWTLASNGEVGPLICIDDSSFHEFESFRGKNLRGGHSLTGWSIIKMERLKKLTINDSNIGQFNVEVVKFMKKMIDQGLYHADFSIHNIMWKEDDKMNSMLAIDWDDAFKIDENYLLNDMFKKFLLHILIKDFKLKSNDNNRQFNIDLKLPVKLEEGDCKLILDFWKNYKGKKKLYPRDIQSFTQAYSWENMERDPFKVCA